MEDNLNFKFFENGRRPHFFGKMEDDLNFLTKWKTTSISRQMEDNFNLLAPASSELGTAQPQLFSLKFLT
jgi:hypothetical protein